MASALLVAAWGWDHAAWVGPFYPPDMPAEWRLAFYANAFRAVLVPAPALAAASREEVASWAADAPAPFAFHVEVGAPFDPDEPASLAGLVGALAPLEARVAGLVVSAPGRAERAEWPRQLARRWPLAWLEPDRAAAGGLAWRPGAGAPRPGAAACFGVMDARPRTPRELRAALEGFLGWAGGCPQAVLCFPGAAGAWREMEQAQVLAEFLVG
jgi:hypothetical protein